MPSRRVLAIDLGSSSARVSEVNFDGERLSIARSHRVAHEPIYVDSVLHWELPKVWSACEGFLNKFDQGETQISSVGAATIGVDYCVIDDTGELLRLPTCHRDPRNADALNELVQDMGGFSLYEASGIELTPINTIFSMYADATTFGADSERAAKILMVSDYLHYRLSNEMRLEYTNASTTGLMDMRTGQWVERLFDRLPYTVDKFPEQVAPGTSIGKIVGYDGALAHAEVIAPASHDTASALVATPLIAGDALYISSGTWSLLGAELDEAIINSESYAHNLTNEGAYGGKIAFQKNITGLWLIQECQREWQRLGYKYDFTDITSLASESPGFRSIIDVNNIYFRTPGQMPQKVQKFCQLAGEPIPETVGAIARCIFDSLAANYSIVGKSVIRVTKTTPQRLHIIGGGSKNHLLSQLTADALGLEAHGGPSEATTLGNAAVQLAALGEFGDLAEIRDAVRASTELTVYEPRNKDSGAWDTVIERVLAQHNIEVPAE